MSLAQLHSSDNKFNVLFDAIDELKKYLGI